MIDQEERVARAICKANGYEPDGQHEDTLPENESMAGWENWMGFKVDARAAIAAMNQWLPIESAPKDGKPFEAWYDSSFGPNFGPMVWREEKPDGKRGYFFSYSIQTESRLATHWRPAPQPPEIQP